MSKKPLLALRALVDVAALVAVAAAWSACEPASPENGTVRCAIGPKPCLDGYECSPSSGTCWRSGTLPNEPLDGGVDSGPLWDAPVVDVGVGERTGETGPALDAPALDGPAFPFVDAPAQVDLAQGADGLDVPIATPDVTLDGSGGTSDTGSDGRAPDAGIDAGRGGTGGAAGTGGVATGGSSGTGGAGTGGSDRTPPQILDVSPFNGQTGVASNAKIVVTFSEPMNQASVKSAYSSSSLLPAQVAFGWNAAGTVLTITPANPLPYASGTSVSTPANSFSFQIAATATDLAGNLLQAALTSSFSTLRRISATTPGVNVFMLLNTTPNGPSAVVPNPCSDSTTAGNAVSIAYAFVRRIYVTLQVPVAPAGVTTVEAATFRGVQLAAEGDPYSESPLTADQIPFQSSPNADSNTVAPIRTLGALATSAATSNPSVAATATAQQAFDANGEQVMIRLQFGALPSVNSLAHFTCDGFALDWTYLLP